MKNKIFRSVLAMLFAGSFVTIAANADAVPAPTTDCTAYTDAGTRQFVESQAWWKPTPGTTGGDDFGHVHVGSCIPERNTLSAPITLDVRVVLHDNPGKLKYVSLVLKGTNYETTVSKAYPTSTFTCPQGTCTQWFRFTLNSSQFRQSGLQEVRFRAFIDEPTGDSMHSSLNWQVNIDNGKTKGNVSRMPYVRGKGWYTGFGYCESSFLTVPLPDTVSGTWTPQVKQVNHGDSADKPVTHHITTIDSDFHAVPPIVGTVVNEGPGQLTTTTLSINTRNLTNGYHKLIQRADCQSGNQTNSGVLVTTFNVRN